MGSSVRAGGLPDDKTIQLYCLLAKLVIVLHLALTIASINLHLQSNTIRTAENAHAYTGKKVRNTTEKYHGLLLQ